MCIRQKILKISVLTAAVYIAACLVLFPKRCIAAAVRALVLCADAVVPTLFPFFVCSSLFISLGLARIASRRLGGLMRPVFRVGGAGAVAVVLGVLSGYPVGAKCAADLYTKHKLSRTEAECLLAFCNNSGPMFVIGTVGSVMLGSTAVGVALYAVHVLSSLLTGVIYARIRRSDNTADALICSADEDEESIFSAVGEAISGASLTILKVCGFVVFFAVVGASIPDFSGYAYIMSCLEITSGIKSLTALGMSASVTLPLISFFLALSGISVLLQVGAVISNTDLSIKPYIIGKFIQSIIAFFSAAGICAVPGMTAWLGAAQSVPTSAFGAGVEAGLWHLSAAIETCGWCAALILAAALIIGINVANREL